MIIEHFDDLKMRTDEKHDYIRYRLGRLKHQLWLENRKNKNEFKIDEYDFFIIKNLQKGKTCIFGSAGYYLDDVIDNLTIVEQQEIVKKFYPTVHIVKDRKEIKKIGNFDNFIVVNNRGDMWNNFEQLKNLVGEYTLSMNDGCLFFYSFRDTQIPEWNRLKEDHYQVFYNWGKNLESINLNMIWHDIKFAVKEKDPIGNYDGLENPDTTNGNIKFIFQYKSNNAIIKL